LAKIEKKKLHVQTLLFAHLKFASRRTRFPVKGLVDCIKESSRKSQIKPNEWQMKAFVWTFVIQD